MVERQRTIRWENPEIGLEALPRLSGLEYLQHMIVGELPQPPIGAAMCMRLSEVSSGAAVFTCEPDESLYNPIGAVHGGFMCTLLDSAVGCAAHSTLAAGQGYTSVDLNVSYLRPVTQDSGTLRCAGRVVKGGRRIIFAEAVLTDQEDRLLATATGSLLVFPLKEPR